MRGSFERDGQHQRDSSAASFALSLFLVKLSMYFILHSTGVCVKCQSDFSGLKSKTHGTCHLGSGDKTYNNIKEDFFFILMFETFTIKVIAAL